MPTATMSAKRCVNCHKDVTHGKRMKDSSGRYWCVNCGQADQKKKAAPVMKSLSKTKSPGLTERFSFGGGGGTDKAKLVKLLIIVGALAAGAVWRYSTLH